MSLLGSNPAFWRRLRREAEGWLRPYAKPFLARVIAVDVSRAPPMAKVALPGESEDPAENGRPFYPVVGAAPAVGSSAWCFAWFAGGVIVTAGGPGGSGGVTDHGALTGLSDDDHPQYVTHQEAVAQFVPDPDMRASLTLAGAVPIQAATWTPIGWNAETLDPKNWHSSTTNPDRVAPGVPGTYLVTLTTKWAATSTAGNRIHGVDINAAQAPAQLAAFAQSALQPNGAMTTTFQVSLVSPTDYIRCFCRQTTAGAYDLDATSNASFVLVR